MTPKEAYALLGLLPGSSRKEILAAYRRAAGKLHPDAGGDHEKMADLNEAKAVLDQELGLHKLVPERQHQLLLARNSGFSRHLVSSREVDRLVEKVGVVAVGRLRIWRQYAFIATAVSSLFLFLGANDKVFELLNIVEELHPLPSPVAEPAVPPSLTTQLTDVLARSADELGAEDYLYLAYKISEISEEPLNPELILYRRKLINYSSYLEDKGTAEAKNVVIAGLNHHRERAWAATVISMAGLSGAIALWANGRIRYTEHGISEIEDEVSVPSRYFSLVKSLLPDEHSHGWTREKLYAKLSAYCSTREGWLTVLRAVGPQVLGDLLIAKGEELGLLWREQKGRHEGFTEVFWFADE